MDETIKATFERVFSEVEKAVVGKRRVVERLLVALLSGGHVLIEDFPGMAKTLLASSFAKALDLEFKRVQFTPDLLPSDITGSHVYDMHSSTFRFRRGPIFTNILLADEINRAPPKTQSALLEAMQERQVTVDGVTFALEEPFMVIATLNPIEFEGTYPLPEAQMDRFMLKVRMGYPSKEEEILILRRRLQRGTDKPSIEKVLSKSDVLSMIRKVEEVYVDDAVLSYIAEICRATRSVRDVEVGVSPRGTEALMKASRALAFIRGRDFVLPDDVKEVAVEVLAHRIVLRTESLVRGVSPEDIVRRVLDEVEVPRSVGASR
ncbi:AAA family ATPase [Thermofilum pendens]|uniref:ATPase associated with various cellular activities, AAA_3 n=1 Tax=Thermofilum pendens (strain DSM 2475 / Hrk 5) TaxID=368408 RepID=A1RWJ4_THEPD|nr:MoxR family ATPase [Thermofilum pendens]ABL77574.1 ATPase associated with various cellular activities, AAA_3 [Thermofilum pendens Hrk 5]